MAARERWFAVVDTAQDPSLHPLVEACPLNQCLITGPTPQPLAAALPYLVPVDPDQPLFQAWRNRGQGRNWGVMLLSALSMDELRIHLKKFLNAQLPDGTVGLFRFYDPRVLRTYLPACTPAESEPWFRGVSRYAVESAAPRQVHNFVFEGGGLQDRVETTA